MYGFVLLLDYGGLYCVSFHIESCVWVLCWLLRLNYLCVCWCLLVCLFWLFVDFAWLCLVCLLWFWFDLRERVVLVVDLLCWVGYCVFCFVCVWVVILDYLICLVCVIGFDCDGCWLFKLLVYWFSLVYLLLDMCFIVDLLAVGIAVLLAFRITWFVTFICHFCVFDFVVCLG